MNQRTNTPIVIYEDADYAVEVRLDTDRDTVWLTQRQMAELFDTSSDNVSLHLKNIYGDEELEDSATTEDSSVVARKASAGLHGASSITTWMPLSRSVTGSIPAAPYSSANGPPAPCASTLPVAGP